MSRPGQDPGQPVSTGQGFDWSDLVDELVIREGSLAAVARGLAAERGYTEQLESVERALRRLRSRGGHDGGSWGARVLRVYGLPSSVAARVRWMGCYHSRFTDLPLALCQELLLPWERPPVSESPPARAWLLLGRASLGLRSRDREAAATACEQARSLLPRAQAGASVEWCLVEAYRVGREVDEVVVSELLHEAQCSLDRALDANESPDDLACWQARLVDQRAYRLNKPRSGEPDHAAAEALYRALPQTGPAFARCRRASGLAWSVCRQGRLDEAVDLARLSVEAAGDAGSLRMRAMALRGLGQFLRLRGEDADAERVLERAGAIAVQLEDAALSARFGRG